DVQAAGHDVLAEGAVPDVPAQLAGPPVEVLAGVDVEGLLRATVVGQVSLLVAVEAEPAHPDRARHGALVDRGTPDFTGPLGRDRASRADGDDLPAIHVAQANRHGTPDRPVKPAGRPPIAGPAGTPPSACPLFRRELARIRGSHLAGGSGGRPTGISSALPAVRAARPWGHASVAPRVGRRP